MFFFRRTFFFKNNLSCQKNFFWTDKMPLRLIIKGYGKLILWSDQFQFFDLQSFIKENPKITFIFILCFDFIKTFMISHCKYLKRKDISFHSCEMKTTKFVFCFLGTTFWGLYSFFSGTRVFVARVARQTKTREYKDLDARFTANLGYSHHQVNNQQQIINPIMWDFSLWWESNQFKNCQEKLLFIKWPSGYIYNALYIWL